MNMTMHILVIDVKIPTRLIRDARDGDSALGGYMGDGATGLDTHHEPVAALRRQRSVTVGHSSGAFSCRKDDSAPPILTAQVPLPPTPHDYNLMTHNT